MSSKIITDENELNRILKDKFTTSIRSGYITVKGYCMPESFAKFANQIENMEVRDDDVWVCSFPKTGTTWTQEMVWCIANDLNFEQTKVALHERFPFLDGSHLIDCTELLKHKKDAKLPEALLNTVKYIEKLPSPRFIKTHLPFDLLPRQIRTGEKKPKILYVARNAKDTCISYYYHCRAIDGYRGDFNEFCSLFLAGKVNFAPYWNHILRYYDEKNRDNLFFLKYEDMKTDLESEIKKTANFLNKQLKPRDIEVLKNHLNFENMKNNPAVNGENFVKNKDVMDFIDSSWNFMRNGNMNQWKENMCAEVVQLFDRKNREYFYGAGIHF